MSIPINRIAIFASGSGTNAQNIIDYFKKVPGIEVSLVLSNRSSAYVLQRAKDLGVEAASFTREDIYETDRLADQLKKANIDFIVLAGFLWLMPAALINAYPNRILNIHPALLPKYGGKGMYGDRVHKAVKEAGEKETGITIHYVNEQYDEGQVIFQARCAIDPGDDVTQIAAKVHALEYGYYPKIIENVIKSVKIMPGSL